MLLSQSARLPESLKESNCGSNSTFNQQIKFFAQKVGHTQANVTNFVLIRYNPSNYDLIKNDPPTCLNMTQPHMTGTKYDLTKNHPTNYMGTKYDLL